MDLEYKKEGRVAIFTINRPERMNALGGEVSRLMYEGLIDFRDDDELWVAIITGAGEKAFSAGADLKEMRPGEARKRIRRPNLTRGLDLWKPIIAAINGYCLGGGLELAMGCDIRIAAEHARLGLPEILRNLLPGGGGTQRIPRMLSQCRAAEILLTGKHITAQKALEWGLINEVVPLDKLMTRAREWADELCQAGPLASRIIKELMIKGPDMTLPQGLRMEQAGWAQLQHTEDTKEGVRAFVEKRKPVWKAK